MKIESVLVGDRIEFMNPAGTIIEAVYLPGSLDEIEGVLAANGVHPDDVGRQAENIRKQLSFDLDFCF